jgi:hypothetical protein
MLADDEPFLVDVAVRVTGDGAAEPRATRDTRTTRRDRSR